MVSDPVAPIPWERLAFEVQAMFSARVAHQVSTEQDPEAWWDSLGGKEQREWLDGAGFDSATYGDPRERVQGVEKVFASWLVMKDPVPLRAVLAAAAAHRLGGDPLSLMVVGGSGSTKTVLIDALARVDKVVARSHISGPAALLSGTSKKDQSADATGGLLREVGSDGILALKDFTTILAMNRDGRAELLGAFREILDGHWARTVGTDGGRTLHWRGRCSVLAACTTAIDSAHEVVAMFGNRFMVIRTGNEDAYAMARRSMRNSGHEAAMRKELADGVASLFAAPLSAYPPPSEDDLERMARMAQLVSQARSPVERDRRGEITLIGDTDAPTRAAKVLAQVRGGMLALGYDSDEAWGVVVRVALDSMPKLRRMAFLSLVDRDSLSTREVATRVGHPTKSVLRAFEDLWGHGLVTRHDEGPGHPYIWSLSPLAQRDAEAFLTPLSDIAVSPLW